MTATIYTTLRSPNPRKPNPHKPYPVYTDTHVSEDLRRMVAHHLDELAAGRLECVHVTNDGKSIEDSQRDLDAESDAADASEQRLREAGG